MLQHLVLRAEAHAAPRRTVALSVRAHVLLVIRDHALAGDSKGVCTVRDEQTMLLARARGVHPRVARTLELWEELLGPVDLLQGVIIGENRASGQNETQAYLEAAYRGVVRENLAEELFGYTGLHGRRQRQRYDLRACGLTAGQVTVAAHVIHN